MNLLTEKDVAAQLGVSIVTLQQWRKTWPAHGQAREPFHACDGPTFARIGDGPRPRIRYRAADVQAWIDEHVVVAS